jgi:hypothetical protein
MNGLLNDGHFKVGDLVRVRQGDGQPNWASDWKETYFITGMTWEHQRGDGMQMNIVLASPEEIGKRHGSTDGFTLSQLELA